MLLEIGLFKKTKQNKTKAQKKKRKKKIKKRNRNCIKSGLPPFVFLQQRMWYVALMAIFIYLYGNNNNNNNNNYRFGTWEVREIPPFERWNCTSSACEKSL